MLHGGNIIFTAILSRILVKRLVYNHHILGCVFSMIGFIFVGYSGVVGSQQTESKYTRSDLSLGIILNIFYMIVGSLHINVQEVILTKKSIEIGRAHV